MLSRKTIVSAVFFLFSCSSLGRLAAEHAGTNPQDPGLKKQSDDLPPFQAALKEAISGEWSTLSLETECLTDAGPRSLELYGRGVAIWGGSVQFVLARDEIQQLLRLLDDGGFGALEERYGGQDDPAKIGSRMAIRVTCRMALSIDGRGKQVVQLEGGRQSRELKELARNVFSFCDAPAQKGLGADNLEDGLRKVGEGKLAPETFHLAVQHRPEVSGSAAERGWLMRIQGRKVSIRIFLPGQGYQEPVETTLSETELRDLVQQLVGQMAGDLPVNLFAELYTDLTVRVLNRRKNLQARRFAGMTALTHGEKQERFDRIYGYLQELHLKISDSK